MKFLGAMYLTGILRSFNNRPTLKDHPVRNTLTEQTTLGVKFWPGQQRPGRNLVGSQTVNVRRTKQSFAISYEAIRFYRVLFSNFINLITFESIKPQLNDKIKLIQWNTDGKQRDFEWITAIPCLLSAVECLGVAKFIVSLRLSGKSTKFRRKTSF